MIDIMLLKAAADACSPGRLQRAKEVASDPEAPRRALVGMPGERAAPPQDYLDAIVTLPPVGLYGSPAGATWLGERHQRLAGASLELDGRAVLAAGVDGADPEEGLSERALEDRLAGYDAMPEPSRDAWVAAFRQIAADWLDAAAAEVAEATDLPRAAGWEYEAVSYPTVDGGQLLVCAADDNDAYAGVAAWFESALFVLGEVAAAAGFHEPTRFDVS
jgi:hypothetical protein